MMTITEFLEARIAEDEAQASNVLVFRMIPGRSLPGNQAIPERVLAECAAKRAIIGLAKQASEVEQEFDDYEWQGTVETAEPLAGDAILFALAAVYADHKDYQQGWAL